MFGQMLRAEGNGKVHKVVHHLFGGRIAENGSGTKTESEDEVREKNAMLSVCFAGGGVFAGRLIGKNP